MEKTLVILKPDCIDRDLTDECMQRLLKLGKIERVKTCTVSSKDILEHYSANLRLVDQSIKNRVLDYFVNNLVIIFVISGVNIIAKVRSEIGKSDPSESPKGTIRGDYCNDSYNLADEEDRSCRNIIHASDSIDSYETEYKVWFD